MNNPTVSKINWLAIIIAGVNIVAMMGYIPIDISGQVVIIVNTVGPALIVIARTWFTDKAGK